MLFCVVKNKSTGRFRQIFVAFSEYMNCNNLTNELTHFMFKPLKRNDFLLSSLIKKVETEKCEPKTWQEREKKIDLKTRILLIFAFL